MSAALLSCYEDGSLGEDLVEAPDGFFYSGGNTRSEEEVIPEYRNPTKSSKNLDDYQSKFSFSSSSAPRRSNERDENSQSNVNGGRVKEDKLYYSLPAKSSEIGSTTRQFDKVSWVMKAGLPFAGKRLSDLVTNNNGPTNQKPWSVATNVDVGEETDSSQSTRLKGTNALSSLNSSNLSSASFSKGGWGSKSQSASANIPSWAGSSGSNFSNGPHAPSNRAQNSQSQSSSSVIPSWASPSGSNFRSGGVSSSNGNYQGQSAWRGSSSSNGQSNTWSNGRSQGNGLTVNDFGTSSHGDSNADFKGKRRKMDEPSDRKKHKGGGDLGKWDLSGSGSEADYRNKPRARTPPLYGDEDGGYIPPRDEEVVFETC